MGRPGGKRPLGRPIRGWEDNISWIFRKWNGGGKDWIDLAQDKESECGDELAGYLKCREFRD